MCADERRDYPTDESCDKIPQRQAGRALPHQINPKTKEHAELLHEEGLS